MSVHGGPILTYPIRGTANLQSGDGTGCQYKALDVAGVIAANCTNAVGLLQNKPRANEDATVLVFGPGKGVAGAAITAGARLKVTTSGYLIAVASGDGACGKAIAAAASGATVEGLFDFIGAATTY